MAIKSKDELLQAINERFGEDNSDETLSFIEDVTDTITELETRATDSTNWKQKYEENDKEWRNKYRSRFFEGVKQEENEDDYEEIETPITSFEQLFEIKEDK